MRCGEVIIFTFLLAAVNFNNVQSARILAVFQFNAKSHVIMFQALLKGLATRGHEVYVASHHPLKTPIPNYIDLSLEGSLPSSFDEFSVPDAYKISKYKRTFEFFWIDNLAICEKVMKHPTMKKILNSKEKYDLVITEVFGVDCLLGLGYKFKAPVINMISSVALPWSNGRVGNPDNPSYIVNYYSPYSDRMNFIQRLFNTLFLNIMKVGNYFIADLPSNQFAQKYLGEDIPPLSALKKNVSLILVNSYFSINQARPLVPGVVEVGGLHIEEPGKLPQDIEKFLNDSPHGVIYFSTGSLIRSETFPEESHQAFVDAFRELPQRVLWKCDDGAISNLPPNIKTAKWMPQLEILSHPNVRLFITHGGLMGTQEAVYYGVPMVGLPMFGDQYHNMHNYKSKGLAEVLDTFSVTKEAILDALKTVLNDPSYRDNAKRHSLLFRDRPMSALDTAIFWTEYVIRYRGAPHLRSAGADLPLYQYLLLDVIGCLAFIGLASLWISWKIMSKVIKICRGKSKVSPVSKTKSKKVKTN